MYEAIVIDDEKWVIKSLIATIKNQDYFQITKEFYDGLSGLEYIRANQPDLAFVDVRLPGMGGLEILQAAHTEGLRTLFIMISGHAEFAYAQKAMFHNAIGYCLKPFSRSELTDSMQKAYQLLEERREEEEAAAAEQAAEESADVFVPTHLTSSHKSVQKMIDYTEQHYREDISIQDLASYCAINANYASQIFKQETGITFISYLTNLRISYAAWLLVHTEQTVFAIATQSGYSDYFYFAKVFKKVKGCTPNAYRKEQENSASTPHKIPESD
ncbi:MAG: response regulator [Eubacteriales bacterium]|nr:response regulator [Eubacteriales bacterium]